MPRKHHHPHFSKPAGTTHRSLTTSPHASSSAAANTSGASVNDLLSNLRRTRISSPDDRAQRHYEVANAPTVHPSLKGILNVADTPPPRPRPGMRLAPGARRGPAGPPPPSSWLNTSRHAPAHLREHPRTHDQQRSRPDRLDRLPGLDIPDEHSLLDICLSRLARNWAFHVEFDQHYLATLPGNIKSVLLAYIATHGPATGLDINGLKVLFRDADEVEGANSSDDITHLDLAGAAGTSLSLKQLDKFFSNPRSNPVAPTAHPVHPTTDMRSPQGAKSVQPQLQQEQEQEQHKKQQQQQLPHSDDDFGESWEALADALTSLSTPIPSTARFPCLTHLSLSHPSPSASWSRLLDVTPHLVTLTHLSLAYWPPPYLTPNSKTATTSSRYSGSISFSGSDYYAEYEGDWSEAAGVLWRFSRATYCLKWLDLEGCGQWANALEWQGAGGYAAWEPSGADWTGGWRGVETVVVSQGPLPSPPTRHPLAEGSVRRKSICGDKADAGEDDRFKWDEERRAAHAVKAKKLWLNRIRQTQDVCESIHRKRRNAGLPRIFFDFKNDPLDGV
ncbi:MAG: hypothetical protein M4579_004472 [Chaenotheca gracillima]|nr:MAG: hypothetical protein M4579_004472 [Chaenotheca gracillima]